MNTIQRPEQKNATGHDRKKSNISQRRAKIGLAAMV